MLCYQASVDEEYKNLSLKSRAESNIGCTALHKHNNFDIFAPLELLTFSSLNWNGKLLDKIAVHMEREWKKYFVLPQLLSYNSLVTTWRESG